MGWIGDRRHALGGISKEKPYLFITFALGLLFTLRDWYDGWTMMKEIWHLLPPGCWMIIFFLAILWAALERIVQLENPSAKTTETKNFYNRSMVIFEGYLKRSREQQAIAMASPSDNEIMTACINEGQKIAAEWEASRQRVNMVLNQIYLGNQIIEIPQSPVVDVVIGSNLEVAIPLLRIENDLEFLRRMRDTLSPFELRDFNPNDLALHKI